MATDGAGEPSERAPSQRRWLAFTALVLYALVLLLSALPPPVRPRVLDLPSLVASIALRKVGLRAGISVFSPPRERIVHVLRQDCIRVRGLRPGAPPETLAPPGGRCVTSGFRPSLPPREWFLRSLLTGGEGQTSELMREAVIGDFFCHGPDFRERGFAEVEVVWTKPGFHIDSGAESTENVLLFRWRCEPPGVLESSAGPSDARLRQLPGGTAP
jgi:hypothetical protein